MQQFEKLTRNRALMNKGVCARAGVEVEDPGERNAVALNFQAPTKILVRR